MIDPKKLVEQYQKNRTEIDKLVESRDSLRQVSEQKIKSLRSAYYHKIRNLEKERDSKISEINKSVRGEVSVIDVKISCLSSLIKEVEKIIYCLKLGPKYLEVIENLKLGNLKVEDFKSLAKYQCKACNLFFTEGEAKKIKKLECPGCGRKLEGVG